MVLIQFSFKISSENNIPKTTFQIGYVRLYTLQESKYNVVNKRKPTQRRREEEKKILQTFPRIFSWDLEFSFVVSFVLFGVTFPLRSNPHAVSLWVKKAFTKMKMISLMVKRSLSSPNLPSALLCKCFTFVFIHFWNRSSSVSFIFSYATEWFLIKKKAMKR